MVTRRADLQFSIAGLLFVTVGVALCCAAIPYFEAVSSMSPPWTVCAVIILMFAWVMIPLRKGPSRAWWIGFVIAGSLYLAIAQVTVQKSVLWLFDTIHDAQAQAYPLFRPLFATASFEQIAVFGILIVSLSLLAVLCSLGGYVGRKLHRKFTYHQACDPNRSPSNRSALP